MTAQPSAPAARAASERRGGRLWTVLIVLAVVGLALAGAAFLVLITPGNPFTDLFRAKISAGDTRVVTGPYPLEEDFNTLQRGGVTTVVTLLNPKIPYEAVLLERERRIAAKRHIRLLEFPLTSVLGQSLDSDTGRQRQIEAIAQAVEKAGAGKVYVHCYLGMHRTKAVADRLNAEGVQSAVYRLRQGERTESAKARDRAEAAFQAGRYQEVRELLRPDADLDPASAVLLGWANYRLGAMQAAQEMFATAARRAPELADAHNGQGLSALQQGDFATAEREFAIVLRGNAADPTALEGLALLRRRQGRSPS